MNISSLSLSYLRSRALNTALTVVTFASGVALIVVIILVNGQFQDQFSRNLTGIDLVVGSKGSPLQLIMSNVFHLDIPVGTIPLKTVAEFRKNSLVESVIPLALGDNVSGYRIVGTSRAYADLYHAKLREGGRFWAGAMEVVLGSDIVAGTGLKPGDTFSGSHGLSSGGTVHGDVPYRVVGVMKPTGTVLDRLALTALESVWNIHEHHEHHEGQNAIPESVAGPIGEHSGDQARQAEHLEEEQRSITALLVSYSSPAAAVLLPNEINASTSLQAASPAYEVAKLTRLMGAGTDVIQSIAGFLVVLAGLSIFAGLYSAMDDRRYDLALMRSFGASPYKLVLLVTVESLMITLIGMVAGLAIGHGLVEIIGKTVVTAQNLHINGRLVLMEEIWPVVISLVIGIVAAAIPAVRVYRIDIYRTLIQR